MENIAGTIFAVAAGMAFLGVLSGQTNRFTALGAAWAYGWLAVLYFTGHVLPF